MRRALIALAASLALGSGSGLSLGLALTLGLSAPAAAQAPDAPQAPVATLVADSISFGDGDVVIAEGNVEILYQDRRVKADRVVYNQATDEVTFEGLVTLIDEQTGAVMTADNGATLDADFERGIINGARFLIGEQLQVAATELHRVDGRYNQAYQAVMSTCRICEGKTPLWQIRAKRIAHDQEKKQLYFDNAVFELGGVPIMYFPKLRMPDPTLRRATGFLIPEFRNSDVLGVGLKMPYFITMGDHADLRLTPYVSAKTLTLEGRYRRHLSFGYVEGQGAISRDDLTADPYRAYLAFDGYFQLPKGFGMHADVNWVSTDDNAYMSTYDYPAPGRLRNGVDITRTKRDEHIAFEVQHLETLIAGEFPFEDALPSFLGRATYERRVDTPWLLGGEARLTFDIEGHEREATSVSTALSTACTNASLATKDCTGRDVIRAGAAGEWRRGWTWQNGIQTSVEGALAADFYWINEDPTYSQFLAHMTPTATAELRWPFARTGPKGGRSVLEPVMQIAWTDAIGADVPNEDSELVEFDEGNLLALSRFPGSDRYERGWRSTIGLSYAHLTPGGNQFSATVGRVLRLDDQGQFTAASGLDGGMSDWMVATQVKMRSFTVTNRSLFDDAFSFSKSETQVAWNGKKVTASGSYVWVVDDPAEGRTGDTNEINFRGDYRVTPAWTVGLSGRYDGRTGEATDGAMRIRYANECISVNFSASRRFTSANNVTEYGLAVGLNGFGEENRGPTRSCRSRG